MTGWQESIACWPVWIYYKRLGLYNRSRYGALPSVVGGLVDKPVIAVPSSVGYGAILEDWPLLAMLNNCAMGIR